MSERLLAACQYWDNEAATFDNESDHGLRDPVVHEAWKNLLINHLPPTPGKILDIGCGTGSLSVLMAELGHDVMGIDLSPAMIALARAKAEAAGQSIVFQVMDAAYPKLPPGSFEVIVCRHLLWALSAPDQVLQNWSALLVPKAHLLLIEGYWNNGGGLHTQQIIAALPPSFSNVAVEDLSSNPKYWGSDVNDERYIVSAVKL